MRIYSSNNYVFNIYYDETFYTYMHYKWSKVFVCLYYSKKAGSEFNLHFDSLLRRLYSLCMDAPF